MARLSIDQIKAPDLSVASEATARAGQSFQGAMSSAQSLLDKYQTGLENQGDKELLGAMAGLTSEEDLAKFLQSTDLSSMNLSKGMMGNILGARESILGNDSTRQGTVNAKDSNSRANANEGRVAAEYTDSVNARTESRSFTGLAVAAEKEARDNGTSKPSFVVPPVGDTSSSSSASVPTYKRGSQVSEKDLPAYIRYDNKNATRSQPLDGGIINGMSFLADMGIEMRVISGGQPSKAQGGKRVGSTNHDHGEAADADFYKNGKKITSATAEGKLLLAQIAEGAAANGMTGFGEGADYMGAGRMHLGYGSSSVWGKEGKSKYAPAYLVEAVNRGKARYNGGPADNTQPITTASNTGGGAYNAYADALSKSVYQTPDQALARLQTVYTSQNEAQKLIDANEAARVADLSASTLRDNLLNDEVLTKEELQRRAMSTPGMSAGDALTASIQAGAAADAMPGVLRPNNAPDQAVEIADRLKAASDDRELKADPLSQSFELAKIFEESSDIGGDLLSNAGLIGEDLTKSGLDVQYVNQKIKEFAEMAGVTPAEAAATMASLDAKGISLRKQLILTKGGMDREDIVEKIKEDYSDGKRGTYEEKRIELANRADEREALKLQYDAARSAARKASGTAEKSKADARVAVLKKQLEDVR